MLTLPVTKKSKQQKWETVLTIARNSRFPTDIIHNLKKKLKVKKQQQQQKPLTTMAQQNRKCIVFTLSKSVNKKGD
jgi:hypothetical protein